MLKVCLETDEIGLLEVIEIDYILRLDISPWYYVTAIILFVIIWALTKRWASGLLVGYMFVIFAVTILSRSVGVMRYELAPFWSYGDPRFHKQILLNIVLFIPVGFFGAKDIRWKIVLIAAIFSLLIEIIQLATGRGLMEFDDVIHNTLGAAIGFGAYMIGEKIWRNWNDVQA